MASGQISCIPNESFDKEDMVNVMQELAPQSVKEFKAILAVFLMFVLNVAIALVLFYFLVYKPMFDSYTSTLPTLQKPLQPQQLLVRGDL